MIESTYFIFTTKKIKFPHLFSVLFAKTRYILTPEIDPWNSSFHSWFFSSMKKKLYWFNPPCCPSQNSFFLILWWRGVIQSDWWVWKDKPKPSFLFLISLEYGLPQSVCSTLLLYPLSFTVVGLHERKLVASNSVSTSVSYISLSLGFSVSKSFACRYKPHSPVTAILVANLTSWPSLTSQMGRIQVGKNSSIYWTTSNSQHLLFFIITQHQGHQNTVLHHDFLFTATVTYQTTWNISGIFLPTTLLLRMVLHFL